MNPKQLLLKFLSGATFAAAAMLFSSSALFAQVKIGTAPTTIDANNNLEVQGSTTGRKLSVHKTTGKMTYADGTQGEGKILTSNADGEASWQVPPGTVVITGSNNSPAQVSISSPTNQLIPDCPITLNKGIYQLYYYAQYDYIGGTNPTSSATFTQTFPRYIYFDFVVTSGAATFPSYRFIATGLNDGPHVIPVISQSQVAAKISQLVVVSDDNTIIKPKFWALSRNGSVGNIGPIIAVKM